MNKLKDLKYSFSLPQSRIISVGDVHGRGDELIAFLRAQHMDPEHLSDDSVIVQLGDLIDCFSFPKDANVVTLRRQIERMQGEEMFSDIDWEKPMLGCFGHRERKRSVEELIDRGVRLEKDELFYELLHLFASLKSYRTLTLFKRLQEDFGGRFVVLIGNHDVDLLRGACVYAKRQKEFLLSHLGFSSEDVMAHMIVGKREMVEESPLLRWLSSLPHVAMSRDTIYMHGGPTKCLVEHMRRVGGESGFSAFLKTADEARLLDWNAPVFEEHDSFLSPDGAENDWLGDEQILKDFSSFSSKQFLAIGHSPFLHFPKGEDLDLNDPKLIPYFERPARLSPRGMLIKHDTNLKRGGKICACIHNVGSQDWTYVREDISAETIMDVETVADC